MTAPAFVVYSRDDCALCHEFISALAELPLEFEVRDVDDDPVTRRRFGLKVPVLTCDGSVVCHGRLDADAVRRMLRDS
jgi:hypothetical protein